VRNKPGARGIGDGRGSAGSMHGAVTRETPETGTGVKGTETVPKP
jgi:hypothetical protein